MERVLKHTKVALYAQLNPVKTLRQLINDRKWLSVSIYGALLAFLFR